MASILQTQQEISKLVSLIPSKYYYFKHFEDDLIGQKKPKNAPSSHKLKALEAAAARQVGAASSASLEETITGNTTKSVSNAIVQEVKEESLTIQPMKNSNAVDLKLKLQSRISELRNQRLGSDPKSKQELLEKRKSKQKLPKQSSKNKDNSLDISKFTASKSKQTVGDDGKDDMNIEMQFGSLDFGIQTKQKGPKDVHSLLKKAEKKQEKLDKLDQDKKTEIVEKETWAQLNNLAQGKVVKEDVKLLKKTVKKKQALKRQNKEKWEQRTQTLKMETEKKQQKRQENIQIKRDQKKKRKRAGF